MSGGEESKADIQMNNLTESSSSLDAALGEIDIEPTISWQHISYKVNDGATTVLDDCSGQILPGELVACMGPSGSGKTTLLDVLANRIDGSRKGRSLTGDIHKKQGTTVRYVQDEDSLVGVLTVEETLVVAAKLAACPLTRVDELLGELGLAVCKDTMVGTIFFKGISGGQKRRLKIGIELISSPSLLLLDEPTSGLDSAAALQVVRLLKSLGTKNGVSVACTIHQPSDEAWSVFDKICFVSSGRMAYFGPTGKLLHDFLILQGHPVPPFCSTSDFVLSLINEDFASVGGVTTVDLDAMVKGYNELAKKHQLLLPMNKDKNKNKDKNQSSEKSSMKKSKSNSDISLDPVTKYEQNQADAALYEEQLKKNPASSNTGGNSSGGGNHASFFTRFKVLAGRDMKEMVRDPGIIGVRLAMFIMLSILLALMFWDLGSDKRDQDISARVALMYFVAAFMVFMSVAVLPFFVMQRGIFIKERCNHAYNVPEYVLAKFVVSIPGILILSLVVTCIVVPGASLNGFSIYLIDLFISLLEAEAFMCLMAALVPHYIIGIALAAGVFGFSMLCEGFFKVRQDIPDYMIWGYYISPATYTFRTFMYNEFHPIKNFESMQFQDGDDVLKFYGIENVNMTHDLLTLVAFTVGIQVLFGYVLWKYHTGLK